MTEKEITEWLPQWLNLFPEGVQSGGYNIRSKEKDCIKKMLIFCKTHKEFTKECIFAATRQYLREQHSKDWAFTKLATYFISKQGQPSLLEEYCERITAGQKFRPIVEDTDYNPINDFI